MCCMIPPTAHEKLGKPFSTLEGTHTNFLSHPKLEVG